MPDDHYGKQASERKVTFGAGNKNDDDEDLNPITHKQDKAKILMNMANYDEDDPELSISISEEEKKERDAARKKRQGAGIAS